MIDRGQLKQAIQQLDAGLAQPDQAAGFNRVRGSALYALGGAAEAEHAFTLAIASNPRDEAALHLRGLTLSRLAARRMIPCLDKPPVDHADQS